MGADVITGIRVRAGNTPAGDVYFLELEEYSKNCWPHTPRWGVATCGTRAAVIENAVQIASVCEGGMLQIRGVSGAGPEHFMRRFWRAMNNAERCSSALVRRTSTEWWGVPKEENASRQQRLLEVLLEAGVALDDNGMVWLNLSNSGEARAFITLCNEGVIGRADYVGAPGEPFVPSAKPAAPRPSPTMADVFPWRLPADPRAWPDFVLAGEDGAADKSYAVISSWYQANAGAVEAVRAGGSLPALARLRRLLANAPEMPPDTPLSFFAPPHGRRNHKSESDDFAKVASILGATPSDGDDSTMGAIQTTVGAVQDAIKATSTDNAWWKVFTYPNVRYQLPRYDTAALLATVEPSTEAVAAVVGPGTEFTYASARYRVVQRLQPRSQKWRVARIDGECGANCATTTTIRRLLEREALNKAA